jgi:hypothetical protein
MKCQVCEVREAMPNSIVCSNRCNKIRLEIINLSNKYTPTNGCENCWGDLGGTCTEKCKKEFAVAREFVSELYYLVRI